jgi:hypothetical protein
MNGMLVLPAAAHIWIFSNRQELGLSSMNQIKRFVLDESALETLEWAIVGGILTAVSVAIYAALGGDIARGIGSLGAVTGAIP